MVSNLMTMFNFLSLDCLCGCRGRGNCYDSPPSGYADEGSSWLDVGDGLHHICVQTLWSGLRASDWHLPITCYGCCRTIMPAGLFKPSFVHYFINFVLNTTLSEFLLHSCLLTGNSVRFYTFCEFAICVLTYVMPNLKYIYNFFNLLWLGFRILLTSSPMQLNNTMKHSNQLYGKRSVFSIESLRL